MPVLSFKTFHSLHSTDTPRYRQKSLYLISGIIHIFLLLRDLGRIFLVKSMISDHIFYMDRHNYAIEQNWLLNIREEVEQQREKHYKEPTEIEDVKKVDLKVFKDSDSSANEFKDKDLIEVNSMDIELSNIKDADKERLT